MASANGLKFKIRLLGYKPTMFRTIVFPPRVTFREMANIILESFRASGGHCYCFELPDGQTVSFPEESGDMPLCDMPIIDEDSGLIPVDFELIYDYGDDWRFHIHYMDLVETKEKLPLLIKGQGYGIIDDIGGVYGLAAYRLRQHNGKLDEDDFWIGDDIDAFDAEGCQSDIRDPSDYSLLIY